MNASYSCVMTAWRAHEAELRNYLSHRMGDRHAAEDLLQEVFVKAMRQGAEFCSLENSRAWLFQVARNALVDLHRMKRDWDEVPEDIPEQESHVAPVAALSECVGRVLQELSAGDRDIIEQCDLNGIKQQAYADSHGLTLSAAKSRLLRARQRMRVTMTRNCQVSFDEEGQVEGHVPRS
ncbi:MAG: sigma-70 family RNA polymerase sigma factor [Gammaproteobacteria bacterium]|nr:sigma-70 family RNA polymerase sigma factor [Gammaproteobacteria bacterium]MBU1969974.1 sigma-70 family RNA polymerase sigma factor [Gammaproteobacteria bacterium]